METSKLVILPLGNNSIDINIENGRSESEISVDSISAPNDTQERTSAENVERKENKEEHAYMEGLLSQDVDFPNLTYIRKDYIRKSENPEEEITLLTVKEGITPPVQHLDKSGTLKQNAQVLIRWMVFRKDGSLCESSDTSGEIFQLGSTTPRQKMKILPFFSILFNLKIGQICWLSLQNNSKTFIPGLYNHYPMNERLWVCIAFLGMYKPQQRLQRRCETFDEFFELALERKEQADIFFQNGKFKDAYRYYIFVTNTFTANTLITAKSEESARHADLCQSIFKNMMVSLHNLKLFETMVKHGKDYNKDFPDNCEVLFYLALALKCIHSITDAITYLRKAISLKTDFIEAKEELQKLVELKKSLASNQNKKIFCKNMFSDGNRETLVSKERMADKIRQKRERHIKEGKYFC